MLSERRAHLKKGKTVEAKNDTPTDAPRTVLPVEEARSAIVDLAKKSKAVVIVGETGSGKTTQIPQYILDDLVSKVDPTKMVGCTQPRRVAAVSIAKYVARCRGSDLGQEVGYSVRFDNQTSKNTRLKFMTDGILLREILSDPNLSQYGAILLDEAHERTLHGDVLFGLLKNLTRRREDLLIVIMSATMNAEQFSKFWRGAPIGIVKGRTFPVAVYHATEPQFNYLDAAINTIMQIHVEEPCPGDILCFLTGQDEIEDARAVLEERNKRVDPKKAKLKVLTLYSAMPYEQQMKVFDKSKDGERKVILATNVAETSITIEGILYVVDCGYVKAKSFDPKTSLDTLSEIEVSRAQALQRTGRAGRMAPGKCYRLYPEDCYEELLETTTPEILRCSLSSIVLQMKAMGIDDIIGFDFMDRPDMAAVLKSMEMLIRLGALDGRGDITPLGRRMMDFPVEPQAAKTLLAGYLMGVSEDVTAIVAMISTENILMAAKHQREEAQKAHRSFSKPTGDHITLLHVFNLYKKQLKHERKAWCETHFVQFRQMEKAFDTYNQLMAILEDTKGSASSITLEDLHGGGKDRNKKNAISSAFGGQQKSNGGGGDELQAKRMREDGNGADGEDEDILGLIHAPQDHDYIKVRMAFCFGYFTNLAFFHVRDKTYKSPQGHTALALHPTSVIYTNASKKPPLILYNNVVKTTKTYMKHVMVVREEWVLAAAPGLWGKQKQ